MRVQSVGTLEYAHPSFVDYFLASVRLIHGLTAILPGLLLMAFLNVPTTGPFSAFLGFFAVLSIIIFHTAGIYSEEVFSTLLRFRVMLLAWAAAFSFLVFMHQGMGLFGYLEAKHLAFWFFTSTILFGAERLAMLALFRRFMARGMFLQNAVILGGTDNGIRVAEYLQNHRDIRTGVLGFIDDRLERLPTELANLPLLGNTRDLERMIREEKVTQVLVALPWFADSRIGQVIAELRKLPVNVLLVPDMVAFRHADKRITEIGGLPTLIASDLPLRGWSPMFKRLEDIVISSIALLAAAPVMLAIALAIKLDSPGPVLFKQKRYGYNNRLIEVFKFRSMYHEKSDANADRQTTRGDDRITRIGRFIRKTSLDELPQLLNVFLGSMSMVGPRPHATATKAAGVLFEDAVAEYSARHRVKPGITGWAQINGYRGETDTLEKIEKRVEFDLDYIERWSVWFDLYILVRTPPALIFNKDVY
ncbi:capsular polysaccharide biosynthesis protein [Stutzerimonas stutzeri ATCC 14405 = CCUG 16156]|uniref:undecaprenyl-phosphate glucose phosphotransferase n=1 Tax=Stutzerimonas stutzeri TaxID=316 RepID=UPI0002548F22|nr:undecaprenyl-phosphate glucose phosphotransferase [Stutzerimonas stutzeri]EHY76342.1 capsular polysaccharide biosynthesis protein [Stutzerimonas stutzeri ATCC 14405 = CCUG 16156]QOZ96228.1 undecaprenyl-phosphate glucose phosphotransferase [Stutzerimonas stutzeri]